MPSNVLGSTIHRYGDGSPTLVPRPFVSQAAAYSRRSCASVLCSTLSFGAASDSQLVVSSSRARCIVRQ
eukprot:5260877-Lingulodinium_polyedra.AAC.1